MLTCLKFELLKTSRVSIHTFEAGIIFISLNKQSNLNLICAHTRASQLLFYEVQNTAKVREAINSEQFILFELSIFFIAKTM